MDSNQSRANAQERFQKNKRAFDDVFGNPFSKPEPLQGHYQGLKARSSIMAICYNDDGHATANPCQPNIIDFFCDVDKVVETVLASKSTEKAFTDTYITEEFVALDAKERVLIEQQLGRQLLKLKISPVAKYFSTVRQPGMMTRKVIERS